MAVQRLVGMLALRSDKSLLVGRQCHRARKGRGGLDELFHKLAVVTKALDAAVLAVGHIDHSVVGDAHRVHGGELLRSRRAEIGHLWGAGAMIVIDRPVAEGSPHPLESATVGIEYDNAMIA